MDAPLSLICPNPAGELKNTPEYPSGSWPLDTPGGRFYAEWDDQAPVTREGQLIFFFQFLQAGGRWEEFLRECPLHYTGNRGSGAINVMGIHAITERWTVVQRWTLLLTRLLRRWLGGKWLPGLPDEAKILLSG
jgi:hypothetical protein